MARRIEYVRVLLTVDRQEDGTLKMDQATVEYAVSDPAGPRDFDRAPVTAKTLPGFVPDPTKVRAVLADVIAAIKTEATVP